MREIVYKNLKASDQKKQDFYMRELVTRDGMLARIERRCTYYVRQKVYVRNPGNLKELEALKGKENGWKKKHFHILRNHNKYTGEDGFTCKVAGTFYAIVGHYVYCVAFIHFFKIDLATVLVDSNTT